MNKIDFKYYYPTVLQAVPTSNYEVYLYFNDGTVRYLDTKPILKEGTVFEPLKDLEVFKKTITVLNQTVAWDLKGNRDEYECIDLDPMELYRTCPIVDDPLGDTYTEL